MRIHLSFTPCPAVWLALLIGLTPALAMAQIHVDIEPDDDVFNVWGRDSMREAAREVRQEKAAFKASARKSATSAVTDIVKMVRKIGKAGKTRLTLRTTVPSSRAITDELQYLTERMTDRLASDETNRSISYLLFHSEQPSLTGMQNPHVKYTKGPQRGGGHMTMSRELQMARKVAASKGDLTPKDIVQMALEVSDGDFPAAMLTAHNFLKEVTYGERPGGFPPTYMVMPGRSRMADSKAEVDRLQKTLGSKFDVRLRNYGGGDVQIEIGHASRSLGSKLRNMRVQGDKYPSDKMGPWYHMFGVMYLSSVAKGGRFTAETWAKVEGLARNVPFFPSPPDFFKTLLTDMTGEQCGAILDAIAQAQLAFDKKIYTEKRKSLWGNHDVTFSYYAGTFQAGMMWLGPFKAQKGKYIILHGEMIAHHPNGQMSMKSMYKDGYADGKAYHFYDNGKRAATGTYKKGKLVSGTWQTWDKKGKLSTREQTGYWP